MSAAHYITQEIHGRMLAAARGFAPSIADGSMAFSECSDLLARSVIGGGRIFDACTTCRCRRGRCQAVPALDAMVQQLERVMLRAIDALDAAEPRLQGPTVNRINSGESQAAGRSQPVPPDLEVAHQATSASPELRRVAATALQLLRRGTPGSRIVAQLRAGGSLPDEQLLAAARWASSVVRKEASLGH